MSQAIKQSFHVFQDIDGQPLENGYIYVGTAGLAAATNQIQVYWDSALTIPATQPIRTISGYPMRSGSPSMFFVAADDYSLQVSDRNNSSIYSALNMKDRSSSLFISYLPASTGSTSTTVQAQLDSFTGYGSGAYLATNQASGINSLDSTTTGGYNTAIGFEALKNNDVGEQNTAVGYQSLLNAQNYENPFYPVPDADPANEFLETSGNVGVGFQAGLAIEGGNYNIAIGHTALGTRTSPAAGAFGPAQGSGNIAIGSSAMAKNYTGEQNVGIGGGGALQYNSSGSNNVAVGWQAMNGDSVNSSVGGGNVAVGAGALKVQQNGDNNIAVGIASLESLTTGDDNIGIGANALSDITTVAGNVAIGKDAAKLMTSGTYNVSVGNGAMGAGIATGATNVAIGADALSVATSANKNVAIGASALIAKTTGAGCVAVGFEAGKALVGGEDNTLVGYQAGVLATGAGNTIIGKGAAINLTSGAYNTVIGVGAGTEAAVFDLTNESARVILGDTGVTNFYCKVALTVTSDERDKTDFQTIPYGLDFVNGLEPLKFKWDERCKYFDIIDGSKVAVEKDGSRASEVYELGFKAQQVIALEKSFGSLKAMIGDEEQPDKLKLTETKLLPVLVKAIQELSAQVMALRSRIDNGV